MPAIAIGRRASGALDALYPRDLCNERRIRKAGDQ
jgi:hypothetical protein